MKSNTHAERRKYHIIYKTTCLVTGRWYLGLHSTDHLDDGYLGSGRWLQASLKKHGKDQHSREIIEMLPTRKDLVKREIELITEDMIKDPMCMNLMKGGGREVHANIIEEKARQKISAASKAMWERRKADPSALAEHIAKTNKPEHVKARAEAIKAKGHKRSEEQLARLRAGQTKYYSNVDQAILKERGRKGVASRAKTWIIEDTEGNQQVIRDIVKFSEGLGIPKTSLYKTEGTNRYRAGYRIVGRVL